MDAARSQGTAAEEVSRGGTIRDAERSDDRYGDMMEDQKIRRHSWLLCIAKHEETAVVE